MGKYKFIRTAKPDNLKMVKIEVDGKEIWAECSDPVKKWAKDNFKEGDVVELELAEKNGKYKVEGKITKEGQTSAPTTQTNSQPSTTSTPSNYSSSSSAKKTWGKTPEECDSIKRQAIGHMVSRSLIALQAHLDPNNIHEVAEQLYSTYQRLVG